MGIPEKQVLRLAVLAQDDRVEWIIFIPFSGPKDDRSVF
jgi:hypothetical protein